MSASALARMFVAPTRNAQGRVLPLKSQVFIAHIRKAWTGTRRAYANCQPFAVTNDGRDYAFAHNGGGKLRSMLERQLGAFRPHGDTGSESAFCRIMRDVRASGGLLQCGWANLRNLFVSMNKACASTKLKCLLTDGEYLLAYSDMRSVDGCTNRTGLYMLQRGPASPANGLKDDDFSIHPTDSGKTGGVLATRRLSTENWTWLPGGSLVVVRSGQVVQTLP